MRALTTDGYGPLTKLTLSEVPKPVPAAGQVLIEVAAASVNPFDVQLVLGYLKEHLPLTFPYVIGMDCAGRVAATGEGVSRFAVGDALFGMLRDTHGSVAEYALANADSPLLARLPNGLAPTTAAALPEVGLTALALVREAQLQRGETALVIGAAGGIGMVLVPLAAAAGVTVLGTAGVDDAAYVRSLGAAETIDHTGTNTIEEALRRRPGGVDVLFNLALDGPALVDAARAVRPQGRLVSARPVWDRSGFDGLTVASPFLSAQPSDLDDLAGLVLSGELRAEISRVYPFAESAQAFIDHVELHTRGKRVIAVRPGTQQLPAVAPIRTVR